MRPDTQNQSSNEVKLSLDENYAFIYIAVCSLAAHKNKHAAS